MFRKGRQKFLLQPCSWLPRPHQRDHFLPLPIHFLSDTQDGCTEARYKGETKDQGGVGAGRRETLGLCEVHTLSCKSHWMPPPPKVPEQCPPPSRISAPADTFIWAPVRSWVLEAEGISAGSTQTRGDTSSPGQGLKGFLSLTFSQEQALAREAKREAKTKRDVERLKEKKKS